MQEYFCIGLSNSVYLGLSLSHIDKLIQLQQKDICMIPGIADFWLGVVNYKSSLLWILDTEKFLNISQNNKQVKSHQTALILNYSMDDRQKKVGLIIENLLGVIMVEPEQDEYPQSNIPSALNNICDVIRKDGKDIALVNTEMLLEQLSEQSLLLV